MTEPPPGEAVGYAVAVGYAKVMYPREVDNILNGYAASGPTVGQLPAEQTY